MTWCIIETYWAVVVCRRRRSMDRRPNRRRLTWFGKSRPDTSNAPNPPNTPPRSNAASQPNPLGRMWQRQPPGEDISEETNSWLVREHPPSSSNQPSPRRGVWKPLPELPSWPPLPEEEERRFAADRSDGDPYDPFGDDTI